MIKIAHRGNFKGRQPDLENSPSYILEALKKEFHVEVDAWLYKGKWYLGHDKPTYLVDAPFLSNSKIWIHAKNLDAYSMLYPDKNFHVFWHDKDEFAITSKGFKWARSDVITHDGIMVMPEKSIKNTLQLQQGLITPLGICSDNFDLFGL